MVPDLGKGALKITYPAVVVERSNALVYLITSSLELKVEGSNPGGAYFFRVPIMNWFAKLVRMRGQECACANFVSRMRTYLDFRREKENPRLK